MSEAIDSKFSSVKKSIDFRKNKDKNKLFRTKEGTTPSIMVRYEEIEQTNNHINLILRATGWEAKGAMVYKIERSRSLGEFVEIYKSERRKNNEEKGAQWSQVVMATKDLNRNDPDRFFKVKIFVVKKKVGEVYLGETTFSVTSIKSSAKK